MNTTTVHAPAAQAVQVWHHWETELTSAKTYANPYAELTVSATFAGPNGARIAGLGFWDGGDTFRVRAMFPSPGTWRWSTTASDTDNAGLHGRGGTVEVLPCEVGEANPLHAHGYLRVSVDRRYLAHADGMPFFWLGDTLWSALIAVSGEEWCDYVRERKAKGFTVIQVHTGTGWVKRTTDRAGHPPWLGSGADLRANPAYWQGVDEKVAYANEQGLLVFFCAIRQPGPGFPAEDACEVARFARYLAARLMGNHVVHSPVADDTWTTLADEAGRALKAATSMHLVTAHPRFLWAPADTFYDKPYIDFAGIQSGAGWEYDPYLKEKLRPFSPAFAARQAIEWPLALRARTPRKPVLNLEGPYDSERLHAGNAERYAQPYPVRLPRSAAYWSFLSGALGFTYGCGGIWNWGTPHGEATVGWPVRTALDQPSSRQMTHFRRLFSGLDWWRLEPRHALILNQTDDVLRRMVLAQTADRHLAVAYLPDNVEIVIDLSAFAAPVTARWFCPVSGKEQAVPGTVSNRGSHAFVKPDGWQDAVLVLPAGS